MADTKISIKLLVDKEKNRVVFAECDKDFADILFSFLTLPLGTVIRLLNKKSDVGCMDNLYQSVESLETEYFETDACKSMLLRPRSDVQNEYRNLVVNVDDSTVEHTTFYRCPTWTCCTETHLLLSKIKNAKCICGMKMDKGVSYKKNKRDEKDKLAGVFVKGIRKFIISDDLQVRVVSRETSWPMLFSFGIKDGSSIEERTLSVRTEEVLNLMNRCMISKTPMTDVFLLKDKLTEMSLIKTEKYKIKTELPTAHANIKKMDLNLVISKSQKKVLYAVTDEHFLDMLFSLLSVPVGAAEKILGGYSYVGCLDNLYGSVQHLCTNNPDKFQESKDMLVSPKIACHYGIENQILQLEVNDTCGMNIHKCTLCFSESAVTCKHNVAKVNLYVINPKCVNTTIKSGGGFVKESAMFMVTDELMVEPLSPMSTISYVNKLGVPFNDLEEKTVSVGEQEALSILRSLLSSKAVFTNVFCRNN